MPALTRRRKRGPGSTKAAMERRKALAPDRKGAGPARGRLMRCAERRSIPRLLAMAGQEGAARRHEKGPAERWLSEGAQFIVPQGVQRP
jgi:hypothetical protein